MSGSEVDLAAERARIVDWELHVLLTGARSALDDLELGVLDRDRRTRGHLTAYDLAAQARKRTRDGFPTASNFRRIGGGGGATEADPTYARAAESVDEPDRDPLRHADHRVREALALASKLLDVAVLELVKAQPPLLNEGGEPGCVVHARIVDDLGTEKRRRWVPRADKGDGRLHDRCGWCHRWWIAEGEDPPEALVRAHDDGRKLTTKLVAELTRKTSTRRSRRK